MDVKKIAFLSLAISAQDGVISEKELEKTYSLLRKKVILIKMSLNCWLMNFSVITGLLKSMLIKH